MLPLPLRLGLAALRAQAPPGPSRGRRRLGFTIASPRRVTPPRDLPSPPPAYKPLKEGEEREPSRSPSEPLGKRQAWEGGRVGSAGDTGKEGG